MDRTNPKIVGLYRLWLAYKVAALSINVFIILLYHFRFFTTIFFSEIELFSCLSYYFVVVCCQFPRQPCKLILTRLSSLLVFSVDKAMSSNRTTIRTKEQGSYCFTMKSECRNNSCLALYSYGSLI